MPPGVRYARFARAIVAGAHTVVRDVDKVTPVGCCHRRVAVMIDHPSRKRLPMTSRSIAVRRARALAAQAVPPRAGVAATLGRKLRLWTGGVRRNELRARERFEGLELDQRIREVGEW